MQQEAFRLDAVVRQTVDELKSIAKQSLTVSAPSRVIVSGDKFRISQVVINLLTNALKYSPEDSTVQVGVRKNGGTAEVFVRDKGIGIAADQQGKIFDRLYQVTDPAEKTYPGLGMGLYIAREIIKRHRGKIWVESSKGIGSTFIFSLPTVKR